MLQSKCLFSSTPLLFQPGPRLPNPPSSITTSPPCCPWVSLSLWESLPCPHLSLLLWLTRKCTLRRKCINQGKSFFLPQFKLQSESTQPKLRENKSNFLLPCLFLYQQFVHDEAIKMIFWAGYKSFFTLYIILYLQDNLAVKLMIIFYCFIAMTYLVKPTFHENCFWT